MILDQDGFKNLVFIQHQTLVLISLIQQNLLDVDGAARIRSDLDVDGVAYLNSQLDVDGTAILRNTLNVQNNVDFDQNLNVDGDTTLDGLTVDESINI